MDSATGLAPRLASEGGASPDAGSLLHPYYERGVRRLSVLARRLRRSILFNAKGGRMRQRRAIERLGRMALLPALALYVGATVASAAAAEGLAAPAGQAVATPTPLRVVPTPLRIATPTPVRVTTTPPRTTTTTTTATAPRAGGFPLELVVPLLAGGGAALGGGAYLLRRGRREG